MIERVFKLNHFSLVDERTLQTQGWLKKIGAMGIDLSSARAAVSGLRSAREFLQSPAVKGRHSALIIFPQGKLIPAWKRPFGFQAGLAWLKKNVPDVQVIPLARRYEFIKEERPQILLYFGEVITDAPANVAEEGMTAFFEEKLERV